ncbi:hypothetical protein M407DRAFT_7056 [Tulasnella calospora MUT 4182]|uniref:F-box domain-containing protein n=1 Tax=Tulasnella calospora MUT 4182 TaxID=1051891 RepID=A0A0C3QKN0_9AGAM|nr:hypothetical protein M407DRAFT_7056 [Tulasnella calospora MUT 4182]
MHHIWNIPELLAHILLFLDDKSDLLQCALVCRAFSVEAARIIWREVEDFHHLLGCFPHNTISTEESGPVNCPSRTFLFLHLPDTTEWDHMRSRASMIKELTFSDLDNYDALLEVIQRHKIDLTFPELISLHLHNSVTKRFQTFLPLFAASRLQELEITFDGYNDRLINTTVEALLAQAHPLRSLQIAATSLPELSQNYVIQLLENTPSIDYLCLMVDTLDGEDIVQAAAQLPQLRELDVKLSDDGERTEYSVGFQSLVSLDTWSLYTSALAIARAIISPNMERVRMRVLGEIIGPPGSLFQTIASMANLNSVSLTFYNSDIPQWADVEPLLSCRFISTFAIASPGMEIDDRAISSISRAWPNLTRLRLAGLEDTPIRFTRPSLHGLTELLVRCPKLQDLTLEVDARVSQLQAALASATRASLEPREKLLFNVRRSLIDQDSEVAISEFLMSVWPGECDVESWWRDEWQEDAWGQVRELMQQRE